MKSKGLVATTLSFAAESRGRMILSVICAVLSVFGGIIPYYAVFRIIQLFIEGTPTPAAVVSWSLLTLAGYALKLLFHTISTTLSHASAYTILRNIRLRITERLMRAPLGTVLNDRVGRLKNKIVDKVEEIEIPLAHLIPENLSAMLVPIAVFIYLIVIDWRIALATLVTIPVAFMSAAIMMRTFNKKYERYMKSSDHLNSVIVEYTEGIEVIKAFNQSATSYEKYAGAVRSFRDFGLEWYRSAWPLMNFTLSVLPSALLGTVPVGIVLYSRGVLTISEFAISIILSLGLVAPLMSFTTLVNEIKAIEYAVRSARTLLDIETLPDSGTPADLENHDIAFRNVSFTYGEDGDQSVLEGVDLDISEGSFTALVGPSGGGKTTIARMIARFWDVTAGKVTVGGTDVREIPLTDLMKMTSFVTQDSFLFDCSIRDNIRMGNPNATDAEVQRVAAAAQCDEFVGKLERGYDTPAGEAGRKLSGGEKQRISLARAMLKNAPIVLLDEATAYADPDNESKIQKSIAELTKEKTLLVIAHRLSTVQNADQIILVDRGRIADTGTHSELLETNDLYRSMWEAHLGTKGWSAGHGGETHV